MNSPCSDPHLKYLATIIRAVSQLRGVTLPYIYMLYISIYIEHISVQVTMAGLGTAAMIPSLCLYDAGGA